MSEDDSRVYGVCNGKKCYSRDEFIFTKRGFETITSDDELIKYAAKVTCNWSGSHQCGKGFTGYYLGDYCMDEPNCSLTTKEYERLKELQQIARDKLAEINAKYKWENYEGRQLTESEIRLFLDRRVESEIERWNTEDNFWVNQVKEWRDKCISKFRNGEVVPVDSEDYNASYGNGTGSYTKTLYSDGSIKDTCYGYLD